MRLRVKDMCGRVLFEMSEIGILSALALLGARDREGRDIPALPAGAEFVVEAEHERTKHGMTICEIVTVPSFEE